MMLDYQIVMAGAVQVAINFSPVAVVVALFMLRDRKRGA